jgi:nitrogen fixation protein NifU and related proteins
MGRFSPTIVDHFTNPRNTGQLAGANVRAFIGNPVCGDQILLTAKVAGGTVADLRFQAFGCSASLAVASLLTTVLKGQHVDHAATLAAADVEELAGGLSPDQRHVATLAAEVAHRLADNFRSGVSDDDPITCAS